MISHIVCSQQLVGRPLACQYARGGSPQPARLIRRKGHPMRLLILSCTLLLLPALALAQFGGFGQVDAATPTFNGSSAGGHKTTGPSSRLGTGIATPGGRQGGPISTGPTIYRAPQPRVTRTGGGGRTNRTGSCPRAGAAPTQQAESAPAPTTTSSDTPARPDR
jgi:hypothetical protein